MLQSMRRSIVFILVIAGASALAQSANKKPWGWTDSERIALRVAAQTHRAGGTITAGAPDSARSSARAATLSPTQAAPLVIDGRHSPELFMPSQLFGILLVAAGDADLDPARRERLHSRHQAALQQLGWDQEAFWDSLTKHARMYNGLTRAARRNRSDATSIAICRTRIEALRDMRERYQHLDEFLYRSIAPDVTLATDQKDSAERLAWLERGCQ